MQLLDQPLFGLLEARPGHLHLNEIDIEGSKVLVRRINDTSHLE